MMQAVNLLRALLVCVGTSLLAGCAAPPPALDRTQYLALTNRVYPNKTREQIIEGAAAVLALSDVDRMQFAHNEAGFEAFHQGAGPTEIWRFRVDDAAGVMKASIQVNATSENVFLVPNTSGSVGAGSTQGQATMVAGTALYDLFWARLDYMLHVRSSWKTCEDSDLDRSEGRVTGSADALCRPGLDDNQPGRPTAVHRPGGFASGVERRFKSGPIAPDRPPL